MFLGVLYHVMLCYVMLCYVMLCCNVCFQCLLAFFFFQVITVMTLGKKKKEWNVDKIEVARCILKQYNDNS